MSDIRGYTVYARKGRKRTGIAMTRPCDHPPHRLSAWWARDDRLPTGRVLCIACNVCGAVLLGGT